MHNKGTRPLETRRLILRPFQHSDAADMYKNWASDPEVTEFLTWPTHTDIEITKAVLGGWIDGYSDPSHYNWVMELKDGGEIIGNISVVKLVEKIEAAEIGYCMGKAWWGQEFMPEALRTVIAYLFDEVGLNRVAAWHDTNNPKSGRVMVKAGMKLEGVLRASAIHRNGVIYDKACYSILRNER